MVEPISVVLASDRHLFFGLQTTMASAVLAEKSRPLSFHLLDGGVTDWQWQMLVETVAKVGPQTRMTRHKLDTSVLAKFRTGKEMPVITYARILTPAFVPDASAIYIDGDFLVTKSMSDLLPYLESGKAAAAAQSGDENLTFDCPFGEGLDLSGYKYANAGLMLLNLEKWRKDDIMGKTLAFLEKESSRCGCWDQTALNWLLRDDLEFIPNSWNSFASDYSAGRRKGRPGEVNLHYSSGMKPWKRPLPSLAHHVWWQFNHYFPPAAPPPNPLWNPYHLARYISNMRDAAKNDNQEAGSRRADWDRYWKNLRDY